VSDPIESIPLREVADLLAAIRDALDVPMARDREDDRKEGYLRQSRASHVIGATEMLVGGNSSPGIVAATLASVRAATEYHPVTYTPYVPDPVAGALAEQRHQIEDPAVPPLAARQPVTDRDFEASRAAGYVDLPDWGDTTVPARQTVTVPVVGEAL
jgi:hypothetical protein